MDRECLRLVQLVQQLSQCGTLSDIVDHVRHAARELASADGASFVLKEGDLCHYVDEDAISPMFKGKRFKSEICVSGVSMVTFSSGRSRVTS